MNHSIKKKMKKIAQKIVVFWVQRDFNSHLDKLEKYQLRKKIISNIQSSEITIENESPDVIKGKLSSIVAFISEFIINMYNENENIPSFHSSYHEEAEFISKSFVEAFVEGEKHQKESLVDYFGIPEITMYFDEEQIVDSDLFNSDFKTEKFPDASQINVLLEQLDKIQGRKYFWQPKPLHYIGTVGTIVLQCIRDVRDFSKEYEIEYSADGEQRCLFNFFNLYLHYIAFSGKLTLSLEDRRVIFAASALHPVEDDYIDQKDVTVEEIEIIRKKILGEVVDTSDKELSRILILIDIIYSAYPINENPELLEIFVALFDWQNESMKQKKDGLSEEELLHISFMKGGYAFAFYGYMAIGKLDMEQFRHFFGMGAIFQIMDDLHDIPIDLESNSTTIWTKQILKYSQADSAMYGAIAMQRKFEEITTLVSSFKRPVFFRRLELFAVRLDLAKFYFLNSKYFSDDLIERIGSSFDIDMESYVERYKVNVGKMHTTDEFENMLLQIVDTFVDSL